MPAYRRVGETGDLGAAFSRHTGRKPSRLTPIRQWRIGTPCAFLRGPCREMRAREHLLKLVYRNRSLGISSQKKKKPLKHGEHGQGCGPQTRTSRTFD